MLRDPLAVKKLANPFPGQKYLQNPKNIWNHLTYQPLLASHVCVCVCVCVCESECVEERRCGVVTLKSPKKNTSQKKHISLYPLIYFSIAKQTLYLTKHDKTEFKTCISCNYSPVTITHKT